MLGPRHLGIRPSGYFPLGSAQDESDPSSNWARAGVALAGKDADGTAWREWAEATLTDGPPGAGCGVTLRGPSTSYGVTPQRAPPAYQEAFPPVRSNSEGWRSPMGRAHQEAFSAEWRCAAGGFGHSRRPWRAGVAMHGRGRGHGDGRRSVTPTRVETIGSLARSRGEPRISWADAFEAACGEAVTQCGSPPRRGGVSGQEQRGCR